MFFTIIGRIADILAIITYALIIYAAVSDLSESKKRTDITKGLKFIDDYLNKKEDTKES